MGKIKYLWMAVEADEYELPLAVADTAKELDEMRRVCKKNINALVRMQCDGSKNGVKYVKVRRDEC